MCIRDRSGIVYASEKKEIAVSVDCPEDLTVSHDSKWTSEALSLIHILLNSNEVRFGGTEADKSRPASYKAVKSECDGSCLLYTSRCV